METLKLAGNVRALRRRQRMSRESLATKAGVSFSTVSRIEAGAHWPSARTVNALATALGSTVADLLSDDLAEGAA